MNKEEEHNLWVCKRIAEIEGADVIFNTENSKFWINKKGIYGGNEYNPVEDKALSLDLVVKHNLGIEPCMGGDWWRVWHSDYLYSVDGDTLCMAICMAVIDKDLKEKI